MGGARRVRSTGRVSKPSPNTHAISVRNRTPFTTSARNFRSQSQSQIPVCDRILSSQLSPRSTIAIRGALTVSRPRRSFSPPTVLPEVAPVARPSGKTRELGWPYRTSPAPTRSRLSPSLGRETEKGARRLHCFPDDALRARRAGIAVWQGKDDGARSTPTVPATAPSHLTCPHVIPALAFARPGNREAGARRLHYFPDDAPRARRAGIAAWQGKDDGARSTPTIPATAPSHLTCPHAIPALAFARPGNREEAGVSLTP